MPGAWGDPGVQGRGGIPAGRTQGLTGTAHQVPQVSILTYNSEQ